MTGRDKIIWALYINHRCNLNCNYCYLRKTQDNRVIKRDSLRCIIDFIYKFNRENLREVELGFFGKEPLLNFDIIKYAVSYIKESNYKIGLSINTNGTLLNNKIYNYLRENNFRIILSIDKAISNKNRPDLFKSFDRRNIKVRTTINSKNILYLSEILTDFYISGFTNISVAFDYTDKGLRSIPIRSISDSILESLIVYLKIKESNNIFSVPILDRIMDIKLSKDRARFITTPFCQIGHKIFSIDMNGDIYPCWRFIGEKRYIIGNAIGEKIFGRKYSIDIKREDIRDILPFDYICYWAYLQGNYVLRNNLKVLSSFKNVLRSIR
ncbi:MAG: radical SAM protein [Myxococcota bacterium]